MAGAQIDGVVLELEIGGAFEVSRLFQIGPARHIVYVIVVCTTTVVYGRTANRPAHAI